MITKQLAAREAYPHTGAWGQARVSDIRLASWDRTITKPPVREAFSLGSCFKALARTFTGDFSHPIKASYESTIDIGSTIHAILGGFTLRRV